MSRDRLLMLVCLVVVASRTLACDGEPCDPGQVLRGGACVLAASEQDAGDAGEAGEAGDAAEDRPEGSFGVPCTDQSGCRAPAPYCARQPGAAEGFCTATGCDTAPQVCPEGFTCETRFMVFGAPAFCTES